MCVYRYKTGPRFSFGFPPAFVFVLQIKTKKNQTQSDEIICLAEVMLDCELLLMRYVRMYVLRSRPRERRGCRIVARHTITKFSNDGFAAAFSCSVLTKPVMDWTEEKSLSRGGGVG